jgi:type IV pilus assembly protein PilM
MAYRDKNLVGLDIDPSGITAAQVSVNGRISIERAAVAPLEAGIVRDGEVEDVDALSDALRALFRTHKGFGKHVRVGVANQKIVVRTIDAPPLTDRHELDAAMQFQVQDELPMPLESAVFDYHPLELVTTDAGPRRRVLLVAARRDMIERVIAAVRGAGLRPEGIDLSAFAMVRALRRSASDEEQSLYLSIGGLTNLAVARGRTCLFTRASGGGLEAMAVELAERRGLTLEHAWAWLPHVGMEQPLEAIEGDAGIVADGRAVMLDGVRRIAAEVRNSLDFHGAQGTSRSVSRAVITGPVTAIPGAARALEAELGLAVELGTVDGAPRGLNPGSLTVAAGLAITEAPA